MKNKCFQKLALPLLVAGALSGFAAVDAINPCLDPEAIEHKCWLNPGELHLNLAGCAITDSDAQDLSACVDSVSHDPVNEVSLGYNELTQLPDGVFADLTALRFLYLEENSLTSLPSGAFSGMSLLQRLYLDSNNLSELPEEIFDGLSSLQELDLGSNALSALDHGVFDGLGALQKLSLDDNSLEGIDGGVFDDLESLQQLQLQDNQLSTLPQGLFVVLSALTRLDLSDNPDLQCLPTPGPNVGADFLHLPEGFVSGTCECPATGDPGACGSDCAAGDEGYVCSGGLTPAPTPAMPVDNSTTPVDNPTTPVDNTTPVDTPTTPVYTPTTPPVDNITPVESPAPVDGASPTVPSAESSPAPMTPAPPATATPTAVSRGGLGTPAPTSDPATCDNGITVGKQVGDACCKVGCEKCGGVDCSTATAGYGAGECCVDTIMAAGVECGGGEDAAPCINYDTRAPTPAPTTLYSDGEACMAQETACKDDDDCGPCIVMTSVDQQAALTECQNDYEYDGDVFCGPATVLMCCLAESSSRSDCPDNDLFVEYASCLVEEMSGGTDCELSCRETDDAVKSAVDVEEGSGAGRLSSAFGLGAAVVMTALYAITTAGTSM
ncbi:Hypothetical leucine rich repeat protein [Ectocarpus siliculosus]|uniref:Hypothetical leucine rich repeat protein n=1 Tax=Ectocarpus siliculosus TaxID=2880 RepID=D7FSS8_ECTSI|nr:Hypothetical leucine rich repeat protein [Ectocarpus siliculosus]|eukprot:CBJ31219.1 Hypothetical leucine rich repeat protein [Ectocarpus siliculosus]